MGKAAMEGLTTKWKDRGIKLATKVKLVKVFPIVGPTVRSRDLNDEKSKEEENWCIWDVVLQASDESVVDGEKNKNDLFYVLPKCVGLFKYKPSVFCIF